MVDQPFIDKHASVYTLAWLSRAFVCPDYPRSIAQ